MFGVGDAVPQLFRCINIYSASKHVKGVFCSAGGLNIKVTILHMVECSAGMGMGRQGVGIPPSFVVIVVHKLFDNKYLMNH